MSFKYCCKLLAASIVSCAFSFNAAAGLIRLDAMSNGTNVSNFWLTYQDTNGDRLFELDELVSFSGMTFIPENEVFNTINFAPAFTCGVQPDCSNPSTSSSSQYWRFGSPAGGEALASNRWWEYEQSQVTSVPEPASLGLLAIGPVGLGFAHRRKQQGPA